MPSRCFSHTLSLVPLGTGRDMFMHWKCIDPTECFEGVSLDTVVGVRSVVDTHEEEVGEVEEDGEEEESEGDVVQLPLLQQNWTKKRIKENMNRQISII